MADNRSLFRKEMSIKQSNAKIKEIIKESTFLRAKKHLQPGQLVFTSYNAKHKENTYDKTPLALILVRGEKYSLVLNFHWLPYAMRIYLITHILKLNKENIANGRKLDFSYGDLKPMLKRLGYAPCIRKYFNIRIGKIGVSVPPDRLMEMARLRAESFTNGKYSASQLYSMAKKAGQARNTPIRQSSINNANITKPVRRRK